MYFRAYKTVSNLPSVITPDTLYFVRVGTGFDLYCSDTTGAIAYKINQEALSSDTNNVEQLNGQKNLTIADPKFQFLSSLSMQVVNLPSPQSSNNKEFTIVNTGNSVLAIAEDGVALQLFLNPKGVIDCYCNNFDWHIFVRY